MTTDVKIVPKQPELLFVVKTSLGAPRHYSRAVNSFTVTRHASRHTLRGERHIRESSGKPSLR
jgi:hypothetical protein